MIELPESYVLADQINKTLKGKEIKEVSVNSHPHAYAWYSGDTKYYQDRLIGRTITSSNPGTGYTCGGNTEIVCEDILLVISTPIKYHMENEKLPPKYQMLIKFTDSSHISCTVQMWGAMFCFLKEENGLPEGYKVNRCPSPLEEGFDETYFERLVKSTKKSLSAKGFLATEQRIPGLGNGVLQDILFHAGINPKTKLEELSDNKLNDMFVSIKSTMLEMKNMGGRDTEKDLFGQKGGYVTILSAKTTEKPCIVCGREIVKQNYLGGSVYYCPHCQK